MHQAARKLRARKAKLRNSDSVSLCVSRIPVGVQELRVLGVEPVGEDGLGVVQPRHGVALHHVRRVGHVVPERVEVEDASVQRVLGRQPPVRKDQTDDAHGDDHGSQDQAPGPAGGAVGGTAPAGSFSYRKGRWVPTATATRRQQRFRGYRDQAVTLRRRSTS